MARRAWRAWVPVDRLQNHLRVARRRRRSIRGPGWVLRSRDPAIGQPSVAAELGARREIRDRGGRTDAGGVAVAEHPGLATQRRHHVNAYYK